MQSSVNSTITVGCRKAYGQKTDPLMDDEFFEFVVVHSKASSPPEPGQQFTRYDRRKNDFLALANKVKGLRMPAFKGGIGRRVEKDSHDQSSESIRSKSLATSSITRASSSDQVPAKWSRVEPTTSPCKEESAI